MIEKGYIKTTEQTGNIEDTKIEFFDKLKLNDDVDVSLLFKKTSPDIVKQAYFFLNRATLSGFETALPGVYLMKNYSLFSKEYVKFDDNNWILYLTAESRDIEADTSVISKMPFAIGYINGVNYLAIEGSGKVFIVSGNFTSRFGMIELDKLNQYMATMPVKNPYKISDINNAMFLADAPGELFAKDSVFYRDGSNMGVWLSFGTFISFDITNTSNFSIQGVPVSLVDASLDNEHKIKKMLSAKSAKYASIILDKDKLLKFTLKEAKNYIVNKNKVSGTKYCLENLIENLEDKGLLGIKYEKVETIKNMYMPTFDYASNKVENIVDNAICFIYEDEYLWMNFDEENKCINFNTYKGEIYEFTDGNLKFKIYNQPYLSKRNYIDNGSVTFTGFDNLTQNSDLDIYFDDTAEISEGKNNNFAVDVTPFSEYYNSQINNTNTNYFDENEFLKTYGSNKYALITGLLHYKPFKVRNKTEYKLDVNTMIGYRSIIDAKAKKAYLNKLVLSNYAYKEVNEFIPTYSNVKAAVNYISKKSKKSVNPAALWYVANIYKYSNGWYTFKDSEEQTYKTLHADRDIYFNFANIDFANSLMESYKTISQTGMFSAQDFINEQYALILQYSKLAGEVIESSSERFLSKKIKVSYEDGFVFNQVSDDYYVNNIPNNEICNHAVINERALKNRMMNDLIKEMESDFISPYIELGHFTLNSDVAVLTPLVDNSDKTPSILYTRAGIRILTGPLIKNEFMETKPMLTIEYLDKKKINDIDMDVYLIKSGYTIHIDTSKITSKLKDEDIKINPESEFQPEFKNLKQELIDDIKKKKELYNIDINLKSVEDYNISTSTDFVPFGSPIMIAYKGGKLLTSIDGSEWFEPFFTKNGIKLNHDMYIIDSTALEREFDNLRILDVKLKEYQEYVTEDIDVIDLNQIKLKNIRIKEKEVEVEFYFTDIYVVFNGKLVKPKEIVKTTIDIDDRLDKIINNRVYSYINFNIIYDTIYPVSDEVINNADEILNNENRFRVEHNIPIIYKGLPTEYVFSSKDEAINNGVTMFVNFKAGGKND